MPKQSLTGSGYDYTQSNSPADPKIGETWYDQSADDETKRGKIYADVGNGPEWVVIPTLAHDDILSDGTPFEGQRITDNLDKEISALNDLAQADILSDGVPFSGADIGGILSELQSGRIKELLLLLQDRPIPEVQDPINIQPGLSGSYKLSGGDYEIGLESEAITSRPADNGSSTTNGGTRAGAAVNPNKDAEGLTATLSANVGDVTEAAIHDSSGAILATTDVSGLSSGDRFYVPYPVSAGTDYWLTLTKFSNYTIGESGGSSYPYTGTDVDITLSVFDGGTRDYVGVYNLNDVSTATATTTGYVTDRFAAPTIAPADFSAWNALGAEDVTTGGSTSANPVEFDILDSTDTVLNSSRIPASEIADSAFELRNRVYETSAGSDGQADYPIPETGVGGHYGIPINAVVSVNVNGGVLDPANWEFDGATTVSIDTSNVTITSGDTVTVKYDFYLFDSTLQPRAYLSRESASETSPSISHFRYEYVIDN